MTPEEDMLKAIFGELKGRIIHPGETPKGKDKQLDGFLTVGLLKKLVAELPDDSPVLIERICDSYFEAGKGWHENSVFKSLENDGYLQQFMQAYWAVRIEGDDAIYITPHY